MKRIFSVLCLVVVASMLWTVVPAVTLAAPPTPEQMVKDPAWWTEAGKPYAGVTIRGVSESTPPSNYSKDVLAPAFTKLTGINVEFEVVGWDQMYDKEIKDMEANTGIYDFVYIEQDIVYAYLARDFLTNLTKLLADNPAIKSPEISVDDFNTFVNYFKDAEGNLYGYPMEAFIKTMAYRTDLFGDPKAQEAFKAKYGYDLAPAKDHKQYMDIAEFFTQWAKDNNIKDLWGVCTQAASGHASSWYEMVESILPTYGIYNWGLNTENWKFTSADGGKLDSDVAKTAMNWWLKLIQYAPPEATSSTWDEVAGSFAAGRCAEAWVYGENISWIGTNPEKSTVVGKTGAALPPTEPGVLEEAAAGTGYVGYYDGGAYGIPVGSKNKEAAALWLQFYSSPLVQTDWAIAGGRVTHKATIDDPAILKLDEGLGYFALLRDQGKLYAGAPPFPFHASVREAMAPFYYKAIAGEITGDQCMDEMAKAGNEELVKEGYGK
jgi:multiple sugar transport system substrate-binding protein